MEERRAKELFSDFPALTYWYGLSISELLQAPRWLIDLYIEELPALQAHEIQMIALAASIPHMRDSKRRSVLSSLRRQGRLRRGAMPQELSAVGIAYRVEEGHGA